MFSIAAENRFISHMEVQKNLNELDSQISNLPRQPGGKSKQRETASLILTNIEKNNPYKSMEGSFTPKK